MAGHHSIFVACVLLYAVDTNVNAHKQVNSRHAVLERLLCRNRQVTVALSSKGCGCRTKIEVTVEPSLSHNASEGQMLSLWSQGSLLSGLVAMSE